MTEPNLPLLRKVWDKINEIPRGSEMIKAAHASGTPFGTWEEIMEAAGVDAVWDQTCWGVENKCGTAACFAGWAVTLNGEDLRSHGRVSVRAQRLLGLTGWEAERLFSGGNDKGDIERVLTEVFERAGERFE